jgi:hypothetical protein
MKTLPETTSAFGDRAVGGYYLDFDINREAAARYGLTVGDVQDVIQSAIGGINITETVEGLERYPVNLLKACVVFLGSGHSSRGFKRTVVSIIDKGAASVAVSARPTLPKT